VRILLDYRPALRERTGAGEYVHEMARALAATAPAGETLVLFSASWKDRMRTDTVPGLRSIDRRLPVRLLNLAWHRLEWPAVERVTGEAFDVVQSAHPLLIPSPTAARLVTIHDLDFLDHPERTRAEIRRDYPALAASHAQRADAVVTISHASTAAIERRLGVAASKIVLCPPGAPAWAARDREPEHGCILYLGTIEPRKNLDVLLDAYARLVRASPDAPRLVLAGRVREDAAAIASRAMAPPLAGRVELSGYVDDPTRQQLYRSALAFVLPSLDEGFGMPALEALTVGVPVIAANRGALPEVVGSAGLLFDPTDAEALARQLALVLGSVERRQAMREAGWRQARQFDWTRSAATLRDAWRAALERRRDRHG
jgi:glycosyltransferase involved in cell wall biosynthesis